MSNPTELPDLDSTDDARVYLVKFMMEHFSDKTFHRYILGEGQTTVLAGDFAWQMAAALRKIDASSRAQPEGEAPLYAELPEHLRQFQHNDCSDLVFGYDKKGIDRMMARLLASRPAATLSPLCGAQHAESGKEALMIEALKSCKASSFRDVDGDWVRSLHYDEGKVRAALAAQLDGGQEGSAT